MGKLKKLKKTLLGVICVLGICTPLVVMADGNARRDYIKSKGKINFQNGTVVMDSVDLWYLADQIDELESTYKITVVNALNGIGTYFRNDGSVTPDVQLNEADTEEEKEELSFKNIEEGILQSQSVSSLSKTQAVDKNGNAIFYANKESADNGNLSKITTKDTGLPVYYQPVTAGNLTAGTAAWVDGRLIVGTGADVDTAYTQGFVDGKANAIGNLKVNYTYHYHQGDAVNGGGCYAQVSEQKVCGSIVFNREYYKGGTCGEWCSSFYDKEYVCSGCGVVTGTICGGGGNSCGRTSGQIGGKHMITTNSWEPACGYSQGQILTATIVY